MIKSYYTCCFHLIFSEYIKRHFVNNISGLMLPSSINKNYIYGLAFSKIPKNKNQILLSDNNICTVLVDKIFCINKKISFLKILGMCNEVNDFLPVVVNTIWTNLWQRYIEELSKTLYSITDFYKYRIYGNRSLISSDFLKNQISEALSLICLLNIIISSKNFSIERLLTTASDLLRMLVYMGGARTILTQGLQEELTIISLMLSILNLKKDAQIDTPQ